MTRARRLFPDVTVPWLDLSTGINPHSYPLPELPATAFSTLPETERLDELRRAAADFYDARSAELVVAAPGTQILLPQVMQLVAPGKAVVLSPTYAEHARTARLAGHCVTEASDFEMLTGADLAVVVNPNNPDGRVAPRPALLALADRLAVKGGLLIVDEAFMEVGPVAESVAGDAGHPGLVVLRSFGKFFGLAGLRLGFALAGREMVRRVSTRLGPWAVSGPALEIGIAALGDRTWQAAMRAQLESETAQLNALLARHGLDAIGGTLLYRFVRAANADEIFDALGRAGILVRNFEVQPDALRFGLPGGEAGFARLDAALAGLTGQ
ncbi:threonine-phosphate decarboxylase [Nitratireductor aestuarii]|uniref:threonine-phosphate decarboxylase n=1 Tax=Nitratireductor aestuarii TaxID=1735103 RepID=A0A916S3N5_9HYPH|nr:threonine-phosphate decarboxylase [Nitratireductor aestuarii]